MNSILRTLFFIITTLLLAGCQGDIKHNNNEQSEEKEPIRIAFNTWIGYSSFYIAEKEGLFDKYNLDVQTSIIDPLAEKNAAIVRGDLDGMGGTYDSGVISAASGVRGKIVMAFDRSNGTDGILVAEGIESVEDLEGKSVAVEEGFVGHFFLLYVLDKVGITPDEISIIPMATDQAGTAFLSGSVDIAVTWEPLLSSALEREGAKVLFSSADLEPIIGDALFLSDKFLEERTADAKNLVKALVEANKLWMADQDKYLALVSEKWGWPEEEIAATMTTVELYDDTKQKVLFGSGAAPGEIYEYISKASDLWLKSDIISKGIDAKQIIDPSLINGL